MTEAPEGTLIRMPDGSPRVKRGGQWVAVSPAFAAPARATPDPMARRQEYASGVAAVKKAREQFQGYSDLPQQLDRFMELNAVGGPTDGTMFNPGSASGGQATGSLWQQWFKDRTLFGEQDPQLGEMRAISSGLQARGVPQGQGAVSNFERDLFASGSPRVENVGPVNANIIARMKGSYQAEGDRLEFMDAYLAANGALNGSTEAWSAYTRANPYTIARGGKFVPNPKRASWRQYFGLEAPRQPAARAPAAPPRKPVQSGRDWKVIGVQ